MIFSPTTFHLFQRNVHRRIFPRFRLINSSRLIYPRLVHRKKIEKRARGSPRKSLAAPMREASSPGAFATRPDIYCELLHALSLCGYTRSTSVRQPPRASRIDDASRLLRREISRREAGAPRETNRNLDVYDACDCDRQARTIGPARMPDLIVSNGSRRYSPSPPGSGDVESAPKRNEKTKRHAVAAIRLFAELNFHFIASFYSPRIRVRAVPKT